MYYEGKTIRQKHLWLIWDTRSLLYLLFSIALMLLWQFEPPEVNVTIGDVVQNFKTTNYQSIDTLLTKLKITSQLE